MSQFEQLFTDVVTRTKRPTMVAETEQAIRFATLQLHHSAFFTNDLASIRLVATSGARLDFDVDFATNAAVRDIYSVTPDDPTGKCVCALKLASVDCKIQDANWYKYTGKKLQIRTASPVSAFVVQYFSNPLIERHNYNSWIASKYPYMVVDLAYARVCADLGLAEEAQRIYSLLGNNRAPNTYIHVLHAEQENARAGK